MSNTINIKEFTYDLPDSRIAKYPLQKRSDSKQLIYRDGEIISSRFNLLADNLPEGGMLVFNNTKVVRARMIFFKPTGARIEIFCLEPHAPADYESAFAIKGKTQWQCMIGNSKKWKEGELTTTFTHGGKEYTISALRVESSEERQIVEFDTNDENITFGELLELLGTIPIPPYLNRSSELSDNETYQTVYSKFEGSVAAPTAGLHFTPEVLADLDAKGFTRGEVTLHVGAGTFLPVKEEDATKHVMHTEHFIVTLDLVEQLRKHFGNITAVGTTSVRTLESLTVLANRILVTGVIDAAKPVGQWEAYDICEDAELLLDTLIGYMKDRELDRIKASTQIMITPSYKLKIVNYLVTNFHQPQSTLLLLISAFVGEEWKKIYKFAMENDYRFLSYGDSSLLKRK